MRISRSIGMPLCSLLILSTTALLSAQEPIEQPVWEITLEADRSAPSTVTILNRCKGKHSFEINAPTLAFMSFPETNSAKVKGGQTEVVPVLFDTSGVAPGLYTGEIVVLCLSCGKEPTCTQDRDTFPVKLTVPGGVGSEAPALTTDSDEDPCVDPPRECEELREAAWQKESEAAGAEIAAQEAREQVESLEKEARELDSAHSEKAAEAANPGEGDSYIEDADTGRRVTSRDLELKRAALREAWDSYKAGDLTAEELEARWDELNDLEATEKLREKDRREREEKQTEADDLKRRADMARTAADAASQAAAAAEAAARQAREAAAAARAAYEECIERWRDRCARLAEERRQEEAARIKREQDAATAAAEAERQTRLAEERRQAAEAARQARIDHNRYLLENIRDLGLISYPGFWETPGLWDWLPDVIENPVGNFLEDQARIPIPTDTIKAIGGLYNIVGALLDPCTAAGMRKTIERLEDRTNPRTGSTYTLMEAITKTDEMCTVLRRLKSNAERAKLQSK
jgi:chemotaxis protein histidine kinase CheA